MINAIVLDDRGIIKMRCKCCGVEHTIICDPDELVLFILGIRFFEDMNPEILTLLVMETCHDCVVKSLCDTLESITLVGDN